MKRIFEEFGGTIITVIAIVTLIAFVSFTMSSNGVIAGAFSNLVRSFVDASGGLLDSATNGAGGNGDSGGSGEEGELNEFGFYYGRAYSMNLNGNKQTFVFNEDNTAQVFVDGTLQGSASWSYSNKTISFNGTPFAVLNNGTQLAPLSMITTNPSSAMNEYGFFFNETYVLTDSFATFVFYEDGTCDRTEDGETWKGNLIYGDRIITLVDNGNALWSYCATDDGLGFYHQDFVYVLDGSNP